MASRALTDDEQAHLRSKAAQTLQELKKETDESSSPSNISSWLTGTPLSPNDTTRCRFFHQQGFLLVPNFVGVSICVERMRFSFLLFLDCTPKAWSHT
jgi:hypothetical protein